MKKILFVQALVLILIAAGSAQAAPIQMTRILRDQTTTVALDLNPKTVFCTAQGYGSVQLKISVPDLDWLAHFDHRVAKEGVPCITGGRCTGEFGPKDILTGERIAVTRLRVKLTEVISIDAAARTCRSWLDETVAGVIRGHKFEHQRGGDPRDVDFDICEALVTQPTRGVIARKPTRF